MRGMRWRMENKGISLHRLKVFLVAKQAQDWFTNDEATKGAGISARTVRMHTKSLVDMGILERVGVFPGHRFRLRVTNKAYAEELERAIEVFGEAARL